MKVLKSPYTNALFIFIISFCYSFIFIFTSNHMEFISLFNHTKTLTSSFWNKISVFIFDGNMKYIGYSFSLITIFIIILIFIGKKRYDEYQSSIITKSFEIIGITTLIYLPFLLLSVLSDSNYIIEYLFVLLSIQWGIFLFLDLSFNIKFLMSSK